MTPASFTLRVFLPEQPPPVSFWIPVIALFSRSIASYSTPNAPFPFLMGNFSASGLLIRLLISPFFFVLSSIWVMPFPLERITSFSALQIYFCA